MTTESNWLDGRERALRWQRCAAESIDASCDMLDSLAFTVK